MLSSHKYLQLTQVRAIVLTLSHSFPLFLSFSLSLSLPCQLSWQVAICDFSTNQRQISRRVRIIFTFALPNIPLDFYRSSVIVIGYWTLEVLVWLFEGFFLSLGHAFFTLLQNFLAIQLNFTPSINTTFTRSINQWISHSLLCVWAKAFGLGF